MSKKLFFSLFVIICAFSNFDAQRHEVGIRFGTSNLVGDVGKTAYLFQTPNFGNIRDSGIPAYGALTYRMNFNPYQTLRFDLGYSHLVFDDRVAKEEYRRNRSLFGTNKIIEASAIFEYYFFPVNNEQQNGLFSPYIFVGGGALMHDVTQAKMAHDYRRDSNGVAQAPVNELDFVTTTTYSSHNKVNAFIPFGAGVKYKFNYNWAVSAEVMFRHTFTDQIDYSNIFEKDVKSTYNADILAPSTTTSLLQTGVYYSVSKEREAELLRNRKIGDLNINDWVNTVSVGLSYSFGRPPCYCE